MGAIVLGAVAGVVCYFFCSSVKHAFGYDDSLDVFGIHGVGGIIGSIGTGVLVSPALGGVGVDGYTMGGQVWVQIVAVLIAVVWCGGGLVRPLQARRHARRAAGRARRPSARASTSPSTASAPTSSDGGEPEARRRLRSVSTGTAGRSATPRARRCDRNGAGVVRLDPKEGSR